MPQTMAQANEDSWPLGFRCNIEFDFDTALSNIEGQLDQEFRKNEWVATLREVLKDCYVKLMEFDGDNSYLFVQITFLDMLWERLFGRVNGPSPWKSIRQGLPPGVLYGGGDLFVGHAGMLSVSSDEAADDDDVLNFLSGNFASRRIAAVSKKLNNSAEENSDPSISEWYYTNHGNFARAAMEHFGVSLNVMGG